MPTVNQHTCATWTEKPSDAMFQNSDSWEMGITDSVKAQRGNIMQR